jgi:integrase
LETQEASPTSDALAGIERAALALVEAVRIARGDVAPKTPLSRSRSEPGQTSEPTSVVELANNFLLAKAKAGRRDTYLRVTHTQLAALCKAFGARSVGSLRAEELERWLYSMSWSPRSVRNHILTTRTLLAWGVARGELAGNVAIGLDLPALEERPPSLHSPEEVRAVLELARRSDLSAMRCLAIRYFAGLRTTEAVALAESEIKKDFIEVTASKSKTRRRRLIPIEPNLRPWLALGGELPLRQACNRLNAITTAEGVRWPSNVTRHSFVSYHLARGQSASATALVAGHTEQVLFANYRELTEPSVARAFFAVKPSKRTR